MKNREYLISVNDVNKKHLAILTELFQSTEQMEKTVSDQLTKIDDSNKSFEELLIPILNNYKIISANLCPLDKQ